MPLKHDLVSASNSYSEEDSDRWRAWALKRKSRRPQSPTLPDDDDLLTSGQVSPLPFQLHTSRKDEFDSEEDDDDSEDDEKTWNKNFTVLKRRRTFHDLASFQSLIPYPLSPDRLKIDVQLCTQLLTLHRREPHLRNVLASLRLITSSLKTTSTSLRTHYHDVHFSGGTTDPAARSNEIIHAIEQVNHQVTETFSKCTNTMRYETEQFDVDAIWAATSAKRRKVCELRAGVFGDPQNSQRQRKLPPGRHGAHGSFNRLQWRLDGRNVLVDHLGRTESEAEEEAKIDGGDIEDLSGEDVGGERTAAVEDVISHPGIKPMWLLRFFTSWGARWSATSGPTSDVDAAS